MSRGRSFLSGDNSALPFPILYSLRFHLLRNPTFAAFTIVAIATAVALATAADIGARSVQAELERTADAIAGEAQLEIAAGDVGVSEELLGRVNSVSGVLAASPLINWTPRLEGGPLDAQAIHVLGVDFLADRKVRGYAVTDGRLEIKDPLRLLAEPDAVIVTQALADRLGIGYGGQVPVVWGRNEMILTVRGILLPGGVADAFSGQVAAMDVYSLQEILGRRGWFDRIDIVPERGVDVAGLRNRIAQQVDGIATVRRPSSRGEYVEQVFGTVRIAVWIFSVIGVLVAAFVSYATSSQAVDRRTAELALIQSIGCEPRRIRKLIRTDVVALSGIGTIIGLGVGLALSPVFFGSFAGLANLIDEAELAAIRPGGSTASIAVVIGVVIALAGSIAPSRRATSRPPLDVLRMTVSAAAQSHPTRGVFTVLALLAIVVLAALPEVLPPIPALALLFGAGIFLIAIAIRALAPIIVRSATLILGLLIPKVGVFTGASLLFRPSTTALSAAGIGIIVGGVLSSLLVMESIETTISDWLLSAYPNSIGVTASDPFSSSIVSEVLLDADVEAIRTTPGVEHVIETYSTWTLFRGREVRLSARTTHGLAERSDLGVINGDSDSLARALVRGEVGVSSAFARSFGLAVGQDFALATPTGRQRFRIAAQVYDYFGSGGTIVMGLETFDTHWSRPGAGAAILWTAESQEEISERIRSQVGPGRTLFFTLNDEYAEFMQRTFSQLTGAMYSVALLSSVLGGVAILTLMLSAVAERRRELALLSSTGATRAILAGIVLFDGMLVSIIGTGAGVVLGLAGTRPMLGVLAVSLGWEIQPALTWPALFGTIAIVIGTAAVISTYPAWKAQRMVGTRVLLPE